MLNKRQAYALGYRDGEAAAIESESADEPVDGWDGWLINSIGISATASMFEARPPRKGNPMSAGLQSLLREYSRGAAVGAKDAVERNFN